MLIEEGNFQHIDFAHHSIFGLEVAVRGSNAAQNRYAGASAPGAKTAEGTVLSSLR
jgi:hypothetical protein